MASYRPSQTPEVGTCIDMWQNASVCADRIHAGCACEACPLKDPHIKQIRHNEFGVFQGCIGDSTHWHPFSETPALGIRPVTQAEADQFVRDLCEVNPEYTKEDFIVEPLNRDLFDTLQRVTTYHEL